MKISSLEIFSEKVRVCVENWWNLKFQIFLDFCWCAMALTDNLKYPTSLRRKTAYYPAWSTRRNVPLEGPRGHPSELHEPRKSVGPLGVYLEPAPLIGLKMSQLCACLNAMKISIHLKFWYSLESWRSSCSRMILASLAINDQSLAANFLNVTLNTLAKVMR